MPYPRSEEEAVNAYLAREAELESRLRRPVAVGSCVPDPTDEGWTRQWEDYFEQSRDSYERFMGRDW